MWVFVAVAGVIAIIAIKEVWIMFGRKTPKVDVIGNHPPKAKNRNQDPPKVPTMLNNLLLMVRHSRPRWKLVVGVLAVFSTLWMNYANPSGAVEDIFELANLASIGMLAFWSRNWFCERPLFLFLFWFPALVYIFMSLLNWVVFIPDIYWGITPEPPLHEKITEFVAGSTGQFFLTFSVILILVLIGMQARRLLKGDLQQPQRALSIVLQAYLALVLMMAITYQEICVLDRNSFEGLFPAVSASASGSDSLFRWNCLYFSVTTASTVGFGDIKPISAAAKATVIFQVLTTQFTVLVLIGIVISAFASNRDNSSS